jgi:V8-like Glu-specific endopeptidase
LYNDQFGDPSWCTATAIDSTSILTAAHCVHTGNNGSFFDITAWVPGEDGTARPFGTFEIDA